MRAGRSERFAWPDPSVGVQVFLLFGYRRGPWLGVHFRRLPQATAEPASRTIRLGQQRCRLCAPFSSLVVDFKVADQERQQQQGGGGHLRRQV